MTTEGSRYSLDRIADVEQLEDLLSEPTRLAVETMARLEGDLVLLGVGGKMGPTLARMARRADEAAGGRRRIPCGSRFSRAAPRPPGGAPHRDEFVRPARHRAAPPPAGGGE